MFPLLPHTTAGIQHIVQKVPAGVCEAFFGALDAAIAACTRPNAEESMKSASDQLKYIQADSQYTETLLGKLVYLQALILMIIATDNIGPSYKHKTSWISLAVDAAEEMKLHHTSRPNGSDERDPYTRGDLGRRAWLILFVLDRWHALGKPGRLHISEDHCKLNDFDHDLVGEIPYHLIRKCFVARSLLGCLTQ